MVSISIHALRGEGDFTLMTRQSQLSNFYPRPPWGGRLECDCIECELPNFYPRPPWGGRQSNLHCISRQILYFYPRPPWGGRPLQALAEQRIAQISIHALRGEGDVFAPKLRKNFVISIHALRGEGDIFTPSNIAGLPISIHALRGEGDHRKLFLRKHRF